MDKSPLPRAKKSLGQHFLIDDNVCRKIVSALDPAVGDHLLEIGPGPGALTRFLAEFVGEQPDTRLTLVEKDHDLARAAEERWPAAEVRCADALELGWEELGSPRLKVVGNLPYNVASRILWDLASRAEYALGVFMIQKEVAERLAAPPGSKAYGALSVFVQCFAQVEKLFTVGPHLFRPRPKVDSAVVRLRPRSHAQKPKDARALGDLVRLAFQGRRKQLGNALKTVWSPEVASFLASRGLSREIRPERLTWEQFRDLAEAVSLERTV